MSGSGLPHLRCPCGATMTPGFPIGSVPPKNVTSCPSCEREFLFDSDMEVKPLVLSDLAEPVRVHAMRMVNLVRACQGKGPKKR
jgi:hypothetical protein